MSMSIQCVVVTGLRRHPCKYFCQWRCYLLDLYRTFCGYAKVDVPEGVDGYDLRSVFEGSQKSVRNSVFLAYQDKMNHTRWALKLHVYPEINYRLLFDLESDPLEMGNLAENPDHANDVERLIGEMKRWQKKLGDTVSLSTDNPKPKAINLTGKPRILDKWQPQWIREKYFGGRDSPDSNTTSSKKRKP